MTIIARLFWVAVIVFLLGFAVQNSELVTVKYFFIYQWNLPLVLVLVVALIIGVILGLLALTGALFRQRRQVLQLRKELKLQAKLSSISNATPLPQEPAGEKEPA